MEYPIPQRQSPSIPIFGEVEYKVQLDVLNEMPPLIDQSEEPE